MLHNIKKVKQTDKRKMHTLLKLIGRTGIWKILQGNRNAANRSKLIGTQPPGKSPFSLEGKLNPFAFHLRNRKS